MKRSEKFLPGGWVDWYQWEGAEGRSLGKGHGRINMEKILCTDICK
jgi:hypothetical protein